MRATWLADVLTDAGLIVRPYPNWETRGLDTFDPKGLILHHTVTKPTTADPVVDRLLAETGSSTVAAPLCNYSTNRDGTVSIIAAGTANHGGQGVWRGVSGNRFFLGDEMKNLGTAAAEPWPDRQLESARIAAAAVLAHLGQGAEWMCGHKEYATPPGRKTDPHTLNMDAQRALIGALLLPQEDPMALTPSEENTAKALHAALLAAGYNKLETRTNAIERLVALLAPAPSGHTHPQYVKNLIIQRDE